MAVLARCTVCGEELPLLAADPFCPCGGIPAVPELSDPGPPSLAAPRSIWRWRRALPLPSALSPVTLGEGPVALEPLTLPGLPRGVWALRDDLQPTGSWKDRGSAVLVSALAGAGFTQLVEDSSGNAALSLARYAAVAGLRLTAFIPASTTRLKKTLIREAGADVVEVEGPRDAATRAARHAAVDGKAYASHAAQPLHAVGAGTAGFNIFEALGRMPGAVLAPAGQGGLLAGLAAGFGALEKSGRGPRPRLIGVQSTGCAPLARAFAVRASSATPWEDPRPGLAEGVLCPRPARDREALAAVRDSGGLIAAVDDIALDGALRLLWRENLRVEPTSALPVAFLLDERGRHIVADVQDAVVILTGRGVRDGRPLFEGPG